MVELSISDRDDSRSAEEQCSIEDQPDALDAVLTWTRVHELLDD